MVKKDGWILTVQTEQRNNLNISPDKQTGRTNRVPTIMTYGNSIHKGTDYVRQKNGTGLI